MANKLSEKKVNQMFNAFCEKQNNHYVSKKCQVNRSTVHKYRRLDKWDERFRQVKRKAQDEQDDRIAERLSKTLTDVSDIENRIAEKLKEINIDRDSTITSLDKIIRLEMFLRGKPDSRPERVDNQLRDVPTHKLLEKKKQLENA